jgi:NADH-quinone oxidoreductase subunit K
VSTSLLVLNEAPFILDLDLTQRFLTNCGGNGNDSALPSWLVFSYCLFLGGLLGMIFNYKNFLVTMMSVELMYLGAVSSFVLFGTVCHDSRGSIYGLLLLILAACESAIGLGILIVLHRFGRSIDFAAYQQLGG